MSIFYYQIKGKNQDGSWSWPPLESGKIEASDSKEARKILEEGHGKKLPGGGNKEPFLLTIIDTAGKAYLLDRFNSKSCDECGKEYTLNEKYLISAGGPQNFCSSDCTTNFKNKEGIEYNVNFDFNGIHEAVIYKITNKVTGLCYIGKTTQAFTLRWYQHFYQGCGTSFHAAIKEYGITNWTFEVIEIIDIPKGIYGNEKNRIILEREAYHVAFHDSVKKGYNSVVPVAMQQEEKENDQIKMIF